MKEIISEINDPVYETDDRASEKTRAGVANDNANEGKNGLAEGQSPDHAKQDPMIAINQSGPRPETVKKSTGSEGLRASKAVDAKAKSREPRLKVKDYTNAVVGLIEFLVEKFPDSANITGQKLNPLSEKSLYLSDTVDVFGRQGVDLVQEGGGVHGIALAGYTYILEKMGLSFVKMAGTSAGAINTMLLSCTLSRNELKYLQECDPGISEHPNYDLKKLKLEKHYDTRSEKLLEYLADKDLSTVVDGHPGWRKLILKLFKGDVKLEALQKEFKAWKWSIILLAVSLLSFIVMSCFLLFENVGDPNVFSRWFTGFALILFVLSLSWIISRAWQARFLWFLSEKMGINPGKNFQDWIEEKLEENSVTTVDSLREKLELETRYFCTGHSSRPIHPVSMEGANNIIISDPHSDALFDNDITRLDDEISTREQICRNPLACTDAEVDAIWDRLVALAKGLPAGDAIKDALAKKRGIQLMPLFMRVIKLQDYACSYSHVAPGLASHLAPQPSETQAVYKKVNLGPYTRELTLITTDITNEIKVEFPAMHKMYWGNNFNMSPACYVRASMALPFFFTPYKVKHNLSEITVMEDAWAQFMKVEKRHNLKRKYDDDSDVTLFVDGGAVSNFPINIYATPEMPIPRKPTLGIKLEYEDETLSNTIDNVMGEVGSIISTMRYFYDRDFISKHDMYNRTVRSIDTGQIHWLNFEMGERDKLELFYRGALAAVFFLISSHPEFESHQAKWHNEILSYGAEVPCGTLKDDIDISGQSFSIYGKDSIGTFRNEDRENSSIRFNWNNYKLERLLALSRLKHQRNLLKSFPK